MSFTGNKDVDYKILYELDDQSLGRICSSSSYFKSLCDNETFWRNRTIQVFSKYLGNIDQLNIYKNNYKIENWRTFYVLLVDTLEKIRRGELKSNFDYQRLLNSGLIIEENKIFENCKGDLKEGYCSEENIKKFLNFRYPGIEKYKKDMESWKDFILRFLKTKENLADGYKVYYVSGDFENQYNFLENDIEEEDKKFLYKLGYDGTKTDIEIIRKKSPFRNIGYAAVEGALESKNLDLVQKLLEYLGMKKAYDATYIAAEEGYPNLVKYLIETFRVKDKSSEIIHTALLNGHLDVVKYMVENMIQNNKFKEDEKRWLLKEAKEAGQEHIIQYLESLKSSEKEKDNPEVYLNQILTKLQNKKYDKKTYKKILELL